MATLKDTEEWVQALGTARHAEAVAKLCAFYEPLVRSTAQRFRQTTSGAEVEELEQVARLAIVEACETFDKKRWKEQADGLARLFPKHVLWAVRHAVSKHLTSLPNPVRLPSVVADRIPKMRREGLRLAQELGREPTLEELAIATGMPKTKYKQSVMEMIAMMVAYDADFLSISINGDNLLELDTPYKRNFTNAIVSIATSTTPEDLVIAKEDVKALRRQRRE